MTFEERKLASLCKNGKGEYGIAASAVDYSPELYTYLRITDINDDGTINKRNLKSVNDPNASKYLLRPNDIVFARTGASTGRNYFYDGSDGELVYAGFLIKFSIDEKKVNPKFIKYFCRSQRCCITAITKMGCDFCGWSVSLENPEIKFMDGDEYIMGTESEYTLYALWQIHTFTIIYNLNGGTNSENNPADFNISSESIELSPATREGYSFEGWYTEEEFQNKVQIIEKGTVQNYELYEEI